MKNDNPLSQLKDIHTPDPISWWPLAPGWWILFCLLLGSIIIAIYYLKKRQSSISPVDWATKEVEKLAVTPPTKQALVESLHLLRRAAILFGREDQLASCNLSSLTRFVQKKQGLNFDPQSLIMLDNLQYKPMVNISVEQWQTFCQDLVTLLKYLPKTSFADFSDSVLEQQTERLNHV